MAENSPTRVMLRLICKIERMDWPCRRTKRIKMYLVRRCKRCPVREPAAAGG